MRNLRVWRTWAAISYNQHRWLHPAFRVFGDLAWIICTWSVSVLSSVWYPFSDRDQRNANYQISEISNGLLSFSGKMPREFARQPRSIFDVERWKATEFRQFLLYTGPVVLRKVSTRDMYEHFLSFSVAISILLSPGRKNELNIYVSLVICYNIL